MPLQAGTDHATGADLFDDVLEIAERVVNVVGGTELFELFELLVELADALAKLLEFLVEFPAGIF